MSKPTSAEACAESRSASSEFPARLSMSNFLRGMFNAAADWNDAIHAATTGRKPFVVGMPDVVHSRGQEDYRPAPLGPQHIIAAGMGGVLPRGAPTEDRKGLTRENYEAWQRQQEELRRAKVVASSPATPNASRPQDRGVPPAISFPGRGIASGENY